MSKHLSLQVMLNRACESRLASALTYLVVSWSILHCVVDERWQQFGDSVYSCSKRALGRCTARQFLRRLTSLFDPLASH